MQRFGYKILNYVVWVLENEIAKTASKHRHAYGVFQVCPGTPKYLNNKNLVFGPHFLNLFVKYSLDVALKMFS
jgi:hypothetical protein